MYLLARNTPAETNMMQGASEKLGQAAQSIQETAHGVIAPHLRGPQFAGVSLLDIGLALGIAVGTLLLRWLLMWLLDATLGRLLRRRSSDFAHRVFDSALRLLGFAVLLAGLFFGFSMLDLPDKPVNWADGIWRFYSSLLIVFAAMLVYRMSDAALRYSGRPLTGATGERETKLLRRELLPLARDLLKIVLAIIAVILIVQSWGYSATALLAGVGLGGLAVAFAAQDTVANVFGSLVIYADRPFRTGDWVQIGNVEGTVEAIGIRSTRIRKFDRSVVSVPNKSVTGENIHNFSVMRKRRIRFHVRIDPTAAPELIAQGLKAIREVIAADADIDQEFWVANLEGLSQASLDVLVYCFTNELEWREYLRIQERLILDILGRLTELGITHSQPFVAASATLSNPPPPSSPSKQS